jgi:hypothetical protein
LSVVIHAQINLVPNPSFEDTLTHTNCITNIEIANHWFNPSAATPDLYSYKPSCINSSLNNPLGYQVPRTGLCYAGVYGYLQPTRDYIAVKLDSNLSLGCTYYIEFYVSLANKYGLACDKMGAAFTDDTTGFKSISTALPLFPAIQSPPGVLLYDTLNWTKISGYYTANGTELFFIIGNFYDDANTTWDTVDVTAPALNGAYYYIDDVKISPCGVSSIFQTNENNLINIQQVSFSNQIKITGSFESTDVRFLFTDAIGKVLSRQKVRCMKGEDILVEVSDCAAGIYFATVVANNFTITKKIILKK